MSEELDWSEWDNADSVWEMEAKGAVTAAWNSAELNDVRGVIEIYDPDSAHHVTECKAFDELCSVLSSVYDQAWYAYVPFDSGEAVFEADAAGYVGDFLAGDGGAEEFFERLSVEDSEEEIFQSDEVIGRDSSKILQIDLTEINEELIRYLAARPHLMRTLDPRKFEQLVAELLRDKGYEVHLTPPSKDGGRDIIAVKRDDIGSALTLVECKRYAADNKVGVDVVRGLYGTVSAERATMGLVATTSYFTKGAKAFRDQVPYRLSLADFDILRNMMEQFRRT